MNEIALASTPTARRRPAPWLVPAVFTGALAPLFVLVVRAARGTLGANPVTEALNQLGLLALVLLLLSISCTPVKMLSGASWPMRLRKMLGLFGFFYACLHLFTYAVVDQGLRLRVLYKDVTERWFIAIGFAAFVLLVPLAVTSTAKMRKRLGNARWTMLHRLAYVVPALGVAHFVVRVKKDVTVPVAYGAVLGVLLLVRVVGWARRRG